jgi:hypothetical protein
MISGRSRKSDVLLFVYGTLRSFTASPMALWLRERAAPADAARTRGLGCISTRCPFSVPRKVQ